VRTAGPAQSQTIQLQDPLEVREQYLDFLSIIARLIVTVGPGKGTSNIACGFMNAATEFANGRMWATLRLHGASVAL
jgi:hypothetical protein